MFSFSLEGIAPGDYEVVLLVTDEVAGKSLEVVDPFSVVALGPVPVASTQKPPVHAAGAHRDSAARR